jgi:hypothetical protein
MVELVEATMPDGLRLIGGWHAPSTSSASTPPRGVDAILCVHGTGSNFYGPSLWSLLIPRLAAAGLDVLSINTRGHDGINWAHWSAERRESEPRLPRLLGSAYEVVDHCRWDIRGWLDYACLRGARRIVLLGHSLGGVKVVYSQATDPHPAVVGIASLSAPRLSHSHFLQANRGQSFAEEFARAAALVAAGETGTLIEVKFPLPYVISAAGYLDKYGPEERYNLLTFAHRVSCPMLFTYGSVELLWGPAYGGMPEALDKLELSKSRLRVAVIAGGDHVYSGVHGELAATIERWITSLGPSPLT